MRPVDRTFRKGGCVQRAKDGVEDLAWAVATSVPSALGGR